MKEQKKASVEEQKARKAREELDRAPQPQPSDSLQRASSGLARPADLLKLQRTVGNRVVTQLVGRGPSVQRHIPPDASQIAADGEDDLRDSHLNLRLARGRIREDPETAEAHADLSLSLLTSGRRWYADAIDRAARWPRNQSQAGAHIFGAGAGGYSHQQGPGGTTSQAPTGGQGATAGGGVHGGGAGAGGGSQQEEQGGSSGSRSPISFPPPVTSEGVPVQIQEEEAPAE